MKHGLNMRTLMLLLLCVATLVLSFVPICDVRMGEETAAVSLLKQDMPELTYDKNTLLKASYYTPDPALNVLFGKIAVGVMVLAAAAYLVQLLLPVYGNEEMRRSHLYNLVEIVAGLLVLCGVLLVLFTAIRMQALPLNKKTGEITLRPAFWGLVVLSLLGILMLYCQSEKSRKRMIYLGCILLSLLAVLPFYIMIINATRSTTEINHGISLLPSKYLGYNWNILKQFSFDAVRGFLNSLVIAVSSTTLCLYFSALTAYAFVAYKGSGNNAVFMLIMISMMIPGMVGSVGFYQAVYRIGATDNYLPLILPAIASSGTVFFFRQYLEANFHEEITEAARVDGSSELHTFNTIVLPMMLPVLAISGIGSFVGSWNNYFTPLMIISDPDLLTVPLMVSQLSGNDYHTEYGSLYLGLTMASVPLFFVYAFLSRFIIKGVSLGAVKG